MNMFILHLCLTHKLYVHAYYDSVNNDLSPVCISI